MGQHFDWWLSELCWAGLRIGIPWPRALAHRKSQSHPGSSQKLVGLPARSWQNHIPWPCQSKKALRGLDGYEWQTICSLAYESFFIQSQTHIPQNLFQDDISFMNHHNSEYCFPTFRISKNPLPKIWLQDVPEPEAGAYGFAAGKDLHAAQHLGKTHQLLEEFGKRCGIHVWWEIHCMFFLFLGLILRNSDVMHV